jgi:transcriptional regulator with XRE-family HTH domain
MSEKNNVDPDMGIGEFIRRQRELGQMSVRQLADLCGVSNAYLSQIERGLRTPSSMILQSLAKGLRLSAETLYAQAGILDPKGSEDGGVVRAIMEDPKLSSRQREILIEMYQSFRKVNGSGTNL